MPDLPVIPEYISVHLGRADQPAQNVTVSFPDYIKNVASSEIYPTWPENAIRANIYAQISFALNRVYTEYYRSRGYDFDITNSTSTDQYFVYGRDIFQNISEIVDELFNDYLRRPKSVEPFFAQYCDGKTVQCDGLSQWGSVELANKGMTPYEILQYYYGDNLDIVRNAPVEGIMASLPIRSLLIGSTGNDVQIIQTRLNRISTNFPNIPKINPTDGIFGIETQNAVKEFQKTFNLNPDGIVGKSTWYAIMRIYNAVKKLNELNSEGLTLEEISKQYPEKLQQGDSGNGVTIIQYFLAYIAEFNEYLNPIPITGTYGPETTAAVIAFQKYYELNPTGIIDNATYSKLYDVYRGITESLNPEIFQNVARPYPGFVLILGMKNEYVLYLQQYLNFIGQTVSEIPPIAEDGIYGPATENAVKIYQELYGIPVTGVTGVATWNSIAALYDDIRAADYLITSQYPGYIVK